MSDARALLAGRQVRAMPGIYLMRDDPPAAPVEAMLRGALAHLPDFSAHAGKKFIRQANAHEAEARALDDEGLRRALFAAARKMQKRGFEGSLAAEAFAAVREASRRVSGLRHHDVQLLAGFALLRGAVAEMGTGEGKTLAAALAAATAAATGAAVHVVTVNDYLALRDAESNAPLFAFFGLSCGAIAQGMEIDERRRQYACDVVYASNKELAFDYLKDRIALGGISEAQFRLRQLAGGAPLPQPILRGLHMAIIDEADSVLIDEARTPLIISETLPDALGEETCQQGIALASLLEEGRHWRRQGRDLWLTPAGEAEAGRLAAPLGGKWRSALWRRELCTQALCAIHLFLRDRQYIVSEGKVQIVDESTGRVMPDRSWERGLHQMVEAKEGCGLSGQRRTLSQITYQRFFGRYFLLCGMTGTARSAAAELRRVYGLPVLRIPTNKPSRRRRLPDRLFATAEERWQAVAERAKALALQGRAVLVGTRSVEASEKLSALLSGQGVPHAVLNARQDQAEAEAVAKAGQPGQITVATNMAGRGTDIKLDPAVEAKGGLHVILTEFHESARVDGQLFGRAARQGNPGTVEAITSLEDALFTRFAPGLVRLAPSFWLRSAAGKGRCFRWLAAWAQSRAEAKDRKERLETLKRDQEWLKSLGFVARHKK